MKDENYYQTLEIPQKATQTEIKQAYRRLAKQFHPDTQKETADSEKIISLNAAYEILSDPQRRSVYDRQLEAGNSSRRQQRTTEAQRQYKQNRASDRASEVLVNLWLQQIYTACDRLISSILNPLEAEIDELSADPFDDYLMENFNEYLEHCRQSLERSHQIFASCPNPPQTAKVAATLYYCLDRIGDGIDELEYFTLNYDDRYLHTGIELFRIARQLRREARQASSAVKASF
jgi:molecular chaperone DnaJ